MIDLKPLLDEIYREGNYGVRVHYGQPPEPPLRGEDAGWVKELLENG